ncbi:MAG TPA: methyltransferase domain-containing protein [Edaphocola sp.]|nr:methyltransferase domain-containing protein [Edaphocola sp.]
MDKYEETFETWNNIAAIYQDKFMGIDLYNETYDYICDVLKPNAKLLEIGCGPGNITKYLLSKRPDFNVFGIDISPNMIELAGKNNPAARFAVMDSRQISRLKTKYDGVIGGFCLPYLSSPESRKLISDAYDLLHGNGVIYLSFVDGDPGKSGFKEGPAGRVFFYFHRSGNLKSQLTAKGFEDIKTFKVPFRKAKAEFDMHTILIAKKNN